LIRAQWVTAVGAAGPDSLPTTSVVLSTRNRPEFLSATVASVLAGHEVPSKVVVDQSDQVPEGFSRAGPDPLIRYLWRHARGLSLGRNTGIAASRGEVLAFLDDDILVAPEWFGTLIRALVAAVPRTVVTGRVLGGEPERPGAFAPSLSVEDRIVVS
jgi:glycosyltransferase involved in cell wall biosynthesis